MPSRAGGIRSLGLIILLSLVLGLSLILAPGHLQAVTQQQSGSVGVEGTIPSAPPTTGATITIPKNGQVFASIPINVQGLCPNGLLVEVFKNNVFAGSQQCQNGSFSISIDLFSGRNDLIARVFDSLDQQGPNSNTVSVTFNDTFTIGGPRISLTTAYAKRGADPGATLSWPVTLSGGHGPYAISVDWGDKTPLDLISRETVGDFTIEHVYLQSGIFNVTVKATDVNGQAAFLQVVGISNGPIKQSNGQKQSGNKTKQVILWWPIVLLFVLTIAAFWLGKQHQLESIRSRLRKGERPFK